jgi:glyoxylase-like metal-dependent hydrolase (beta-lactamase superfamily II)
MRKLAHLAAAVALSVASSSSCTPAGSLEAAAEDLGVENLTSIRLEGTGANFSVGQPYVAGQEWPRVDIVSYTAEVDYGTGSMRTDMLRQQPNPEPPGGGVRFAGQQRNIQVVSGTSAWNVPAAADGSLGAPQPQPAAAAERALQIWTTPHGFVKAAASHAATVEEMDGGGSRASFALESGHRVEGTINASNEVESVTTWLDNPVLGDMVVETRYSDYQDFGGVRFPARIQQTQGGHPALDLTITAVTANAPVEITVPEEVASFQPAALQATFEQVAPGIHYVRGGSHHSVAIEMSDHVVLVEAPQSEERAIAVIDAVTQALPDKPIRYVVNTHVHFDHSGGLRPLVDAGATVVTHESNQAFYETAWAAPRTLNPDRLARSGKVATIQAVGDRGELTDGSRTVELHTIKDAAHNTGFLMVWLPRERILIQADAFTPPAPNAPPPATPNPNTVALYNSVQALNLPVRQVLGIHGNRPGTLAELRAAAGQ